MSIRHQNFYNANASRSYPFDDRATRTGDGGERFPNDIIVDLNLRFPITLGEYAYVSSLSVTSKLVTLTFLACPSPDAPPATFVPLAAVTVRKPVRSYRHYPLTALHPGVGGWIVFQDLEENASVRFSSPLQSLLLPKCARPYRLIPVRSLGKVGVAGGLEGVVQLKAGTDMEIVSGTRTIDGREREVAVVRLKSFSGGRNVLDLYRGPCGARPESDNCDRPGVEFLNTVGPDCDGNISIVFRGGTVATPHDGSSEGLILDFPLGLTEACTRDDRLPDATGRLPNEFDDTCTSEYEGQIGDDDDDNIGLPSDVSNLPSTSSESTECPELPHLESFDDGNADNFSVLEGEFLFVEDDTPSQPEEVVLMSMSASSDSYIERGYLANSIVSRNVSVWNVCSTTEALNRRVTTDLKLTDVPGHPSHNGGLVLNYHTVGTTIERDEYFIAEIDLPSDGIRLRRWGGSSFFTIGSISGLGLAAGDWYRLTAEITPGPDPVTQTRIKVIVEGLDNPAIVAQFTSLTKAYLPADGRFGLGSDSGRTTFGYFLLENM